MYNVLLTGNTLPCIRYFTKNVKSTLQMTNINCNKMQITDSKIHIHVYKQI
jgi:hypothetical protein